MFLLPSGLGMHSEGQDRDHPIVLEGYKKDEFTCLLKVMYPTYVHVVFICINLFQPVDFDRARSLIPGGTPELQLKKEEWVNVLKLSTIWAMTKVCRTQSVVSQAGLTDTRYLLFID